MEGTAEIDFYKLLKKNSFSDEDAAQFVALQKKMQSANLATKTDLSEVRTALEADIADLRSELKADIADVRSELKAEMADLRSEMKADIAGTKSALTWRMFVFWLGQVAATLAIVKYTL